MYIQQQLSKGLQKALCTALTATILGILGAPQALAERLYHPDGAKLTFGGMTHRQPVVSDMGNPAHPAIDPTPDDDAGRYGIGLGFGIGIEYDGNDNFFKLLDQLGSDDSVGSGGGTGGGSGEDGVDGPILPPIAIDPEVEAAVEELAKKAIAIAGVLAVATTGLNAKAFVSTDVPLLISHDILGGSWNFYANTSVLTNIRGLHDPIEFDKDQALRTLQSRNTSASTPVTYDLTGGLKLTVYPDGSTKFQFENNSGMITRAAHITEYAIGYSRKIWQQEDNQVYIGIKPKLMDVGLSNAAIPIADIHKAKDIFESLDSSSFKYSQNYSVDLGAIWTGKQFQLGVTATNLNEPSFHYPASDLSGFTNQRIIDAIRARETWTMERQLKIEGGLITQSGAWGISFGYDVNAVPDAMGDDYQWLSVGTGFASGNWWLPGARLGARKNLSGTQLTYITAGITVFNIVNLDLATTTDTITVDDTTVPRGLIFNISAQLLF